jgi:ATP-dependent Clp protease protease subunit
MNSEKEKTSIYFSGNKFFITYDFNKKMKDGMIIPLANEIDHQATLKNGVIDFYINSHGGDSELCMYIVSMIEFAKSKGIKVRTIISDIAYSAGSVVSVAGTKGERYIARTAEYCVHYGSQAGWRESTPLQIDRNSEHKKRHFNKLLNHYKKYCNIPKLEEALKDDSFFITAQQGIKWGLADKYIERLK